MSVQLSVMQRSRFVFQDYMVLTRGANRGYLMPNWKWFSVNLQGSGNIDCLGSVCFNGSQSNGGGPIEKLQPVTIGQCDGPSQCNSVNLHQRTSPSIRTGDPLETFAR